MRIHTIQQGEKMKKNERGSSEAVVMVAVVLGIILVPLLIWLLTVALADPVGKGEAYKETHGDGTYRNAQYDKFFQLCSAVQSAETRIQTAEDTLKADTENGADPGTLSLDRTNLTAAQNQRAELINQYNAAASSNQTKGFLRDEDLPANIDPNKENTKCAS